MNCTTPTPTEPFREIESLLGESARAESTGRRPSVPSLERAAVTDRVAAKHFVSAADLTATDHSHETARMLENLDSLQRLSSDLSADLSQESSTEVSGVEAPPAVDFPVPPGWRLSIVIPVYNEARTIRNVLARVASIPLPKEIIVVDDASTDGTRGVLEQLRDVYGLVLVGKPQNEGKGAALRTGFAQARGDVIVVQDADLEYNPRDIVPLVRPLLEGRADVVYGSRFLGEVPQDKSLVHRLGNALLTWASNVTTGQRLTDMETCYKAFRRGVIESFAIEQNRFGFEPEVTAKIARRKFRVVEVPISYSARSYAEGKKIGVKDLISTLYCIARYAVRD
jgi:hypothetical protein